MIFFNSWSVTVSLDGRKKFFLNGQAVTRAWKMNIQNELQCNQCCKYWFETCYQSPENFEIHFEIINYSLKKKKTKDVHIFY